MRTIWRMALNDVRLTARDRAAFFWMLLMPIGFMWIFGNFTGGGASDRKISLTVIDNDRGWLSRAFLDELADESVTMEELTPGEGATAENKVRTLVIPEGFTGKVLAGEQQTLSLVNEKGSNEEFGLAARMHVVRAIVRTIGRLVEMGADGTGNAGEEARPDERFRQLAGSPDLVTLAVTTAGHGHAVPAGFNQSVPGILTMVVIMMTLIYGSVFLTIEKREGMLRRQVSLPVSRSRIYLGKLAGRLMIAGFQIAILLVAGRTLFGVSWGDSPLGLVMVLGSLAAAAAGLATLMGAVLSTPEQAASLGWLVSMGLAGLGGCWWPAEVMPRWLQTAAHVLPSAWAMDGLHALISFGRGAGSVVLPSTVLLGFGALFAVLGSRFLRYD